MNIVALSLLLSLCFSTPAYAQDEIKPLNEYKDEQCVMTRNMNHLGNTLSMCIENSHSLNITDAQLQTIKPLHSEMQKKNVRFKAEMRIAEIDLRDIMDVKDFDLGKANTGAQHIGQIQTTHHLEMLKAMKEMRAVLTDEQFLKMKKTMPMKAAGNKQKAMKMKK